MDKRGQIGIYVIIGIIIVAVVGFVSYSIVAKTGWMPWQQSMPVPNEYIDKCVKDAVRDSVDIMLRQGGYLSPPTLYRNWSYDGAAQRIAYLCYFRNYYLPCVQQEPMYLEHLEDEILGYVEDKVENCFLDMKSQYESGGYSVNMGNSVIEVNLKPGKINIDIENKFDVSKNEEKRRFDKLISVVESPLYDLGRVVVDITSQEGQFCYFSTDGYSLMYPDVHVESKMLYDETKIYTVTDKASGKKLMFATRSCALPPGR